MFKTLLNMIVGGVVVAVLLYLFAPGLWTKVEKTYHEKAGWTEEAKRADPIRYLEDTIAKTRQAYGKIDQYIREYRLSLSQLDRERKKARDKADKANGLLAELKDLYKKAQAGELQWPVTFRGGQYQESQLREQVRTLLHERDASRQVADKLTRRIDEMVKKLDKIRAARVEYASKISVLESELTMAKANIGSEDLDRLIRNADEVLAYIDDVSDDISTPLRTTDELLEQESETQKQEGDKQVDEFLNS